MKLPNKPQAGDPLMPFISDSSMWSALFDMVSAWKNGEIETNRRRKGLKTTLTGAADVKDVKGLTLQVIQFTPALTGTNDAVDNILKRKPLFSLLDPIWHSRIHEVVIVNRDIPVDSVGPVGGQRYVTMPVKEYQYSDAYYAMIDPDDPTTLKASSSGIYKIIGQYFDGNGHCVLDTQASQPLWRCQLKEDGGAATVSVELFNLKGDRSFGIATVSDPMTFFADLDAGDDALCMHVGNEFYALATDPVIDCFKICEKCDPVASETGECTPETDPECCTTSSQKDCPYTNKAITALNLESQELGSEFTYVQIGDSDYEEGGTLCDWTVPVQRSDGEFRDVIVARASGDLDNWTATVDGKVWKSGLGNEDCSGTANLTEQGHPGTGSFTHTEADKNVCLACEIDGKSVLKITTSGFVDCQSTAGDPTDCNGVTIPFSNYNGEFEVPLFDEKPVLGQDYLFDETFTLFSHDCDTASNCQSSPGLEYRIRFEGRAQCDATNGTVVLEFRARTNWQNGAGQVFAVPGSYSGQLIVTGCCEPDIIPNPVDQLGDITIAIE